VGGAVRDLILRRPTGDWDVSTDATPQQVSSIFRKVIPTGMKHGTVTVIINSTKVEVTTFRIEGKYSDGRRPDSVRYASDIREDVKRRDFTISAMAYDPLSDEFIDEFGGLKDLRCKVIRTVGDPVERFEEDGLRPLRAIRLATVMEFNIDKDTLEAIRPSIGTFRKVAPERVREEIVKMLLADKPSAGIEVMRDTGLLDEIIPELCEGIGVDQPIQYHKYDCYTHSLKCLDLSSGDPIFRFAVLMHDVGKPRSRIKKGTEYRFYGHENIGAEMTKDVMERLRFSKENINFVTILIRNHMFNYEDSWSDAAIRRFIRRIGTENIESLFALRIADAKGSGIPIDERLEKIEQLRKRIVKVLDQQMALKVTDLDIDGHQVMKILNIPPGKKVGRALNYLLEVVTENPELNKFEELRQILLNLPEEELG
jgi:poly(A) polymerase/tRNA nucleotidyltransferase (CCA-adding enzyme)